jgi:glutamate synthase (NADPH/NADH) large chain
MLKKNGLYDPRNEHDSCGVGFVADIGARKTHLIVRQGIEILMRLQHRGSTGGDEKTGDGAGILFQIPDAFFRRVCAEKKMDLPPAGNYATGFVFMPHDKTEFSKTQGIFSKTASEENLQIIGWREVPVNKNALGQQALKTCPVMMQIFIGNEAKKETTADFERRLYLFRRLVEKRSIVALREESIFYIPSLSSKTIVYKGLLLADQLEKFYLDLSENDLSSAFSLVHQRYSTNTFPTWPLAQPFRALAHNGEINTLRGNINQMTTREKSLRSDFYGDKTKELLPIIQEGISDSACLDNVLEFLTMNGKALSHSMLMLLPQAWGEKYRLGRDIRSFFDYHAGVMEPWDGPAAVTFTDGSAIGALLDRNGLRPARYTITDDNIIVFASETGVLDIPPEKIVRKGRLGPGQIILVDFEKNRILLDNEIKTICARARPYRRWIEENRVSMHGLFDSVNPPTVDQTSIIKRQMLFGYTREDINMIIKPMAESGAEPVGSMGNDAALAVLSEKTQLLFSYFKQLFAQVTNPPIDPIREELVMSLTTFIGNSPDILHETPSHAGLIRLKNPILTDEDLLSLRNSQIKSFGATVIPMTFESNVENPGLALKKALDSICSQTEDSIASGKNILILSDRNIPETTIPIPSLLALTAINNYLCRKGLRTGASLIIETGEVREIMHYALLFGYNVTAINPYLALETVANLAVSGFLEGNMSVVKAEENYIKAVCKGLLKTMSKMGISTLRSYRGSQIFEALGLEKNFIDTYFPGTNSRISGIGLDDVALEAMLRWKKANSERHEKSIDLDGGGQYHFRKGEEKHLWTHETITKLQQASRTNNYSIYKDYAKLINDQSKNLCTIRGLFKFKKSSPIPLDEVEPESNIVKKFVTGAMSFGSISKEAHETIAAAMNRLGGMSNSGEGGEDPARNIPLPNGDCIASAIKQVASGRFGVTIEYLSNARELQIKMAQGAKPGEGGQLPGHKVDKIIAGVRHSTPGVTLISPPPHHDIYSIEDLSQLIFDLKNANPSARISVKLVSEVGVGTIAAGVSKAKADLVLISGHDGGTGASPLSSIKHAGLPWEFGLAETQQTLVMNHLRDRIKIQADGQMKTGRDIVIAAMLGAEEYGFATAPLVVCGCLMMRKCHKNTCPVGVATQDPELRKFFTGKPEYLVNFFTMLAREIREILAELGFKKLDDIIGRGDLLEKNEAINFWKAKNLDFSAIFATAPNPEHHPLRNTKNQNHSLENVKDRLLIEKAKDAIENKKNIRACFTIKNSDRTVGALLSHTIALKYGNKGLPDESINFEFRGSAGQSFGAFLSKGVTLTLIGEANDYLGKGLSGGKIVLKTPENIKFDPSINSIAGNALLYGGTSGEVYIQGQVGERFAVRNSGANAVIEGAGDHCCEYMTGGRVVILGAVGVNFGAGMSGGIAYVFDENGTFDEFCNTDTLDLDLLVLPKDISELRTIIELHHKYTGSKKAASILNDWENSLPRFVKVFPVEYKKALGQMMREDAEIKRIKVQD